MADLQREGASNGERPSDKPSSERVLTKAVSGVVATFDPGLLPFKPIASSELVKIGERVGVFTPIADAKDPGSEGNLEKVVDALRQRVSELENENLALRRALEDQESE